MPRHAARLLSLLALISMFSAAALLTGCGGSPSVEEVHRELQSRFPQATFEPREHVHLGRISLGLLHGLVRMANAGDADDDASTIVSGIGGVDFASYKVHGLPDLDGLAGSPRFAQQLARSGWTLMVRTREENGERTWVYVRSDEQGALRNLFVVSLEKDELTLVRLDGHLDRAVAAALAQHPKSMFDGKKKKKQTVETAEVAAQPAGR